MIAIGAPCLGDLAIFRQRPEPVLIQALLLLA